MASECSGSSVLELSAREPGWQFTGRFQSICEFCSKMFLVDKCLYRFQVIILGEKLAFYVCFDMIPFVTPNAYFFPKKQVRIHVRITLMQLSIHIRTSISHYSVSIPGYPHYIYDTEIRVLYIYDFSYSYEPYILYEV